MNDIDEMSLKYRVMFRKNPRVKPKNVPRNSQASPDAR